MTDQNRRLALIFSALAVVAMLPLAMGLSALEMKPGQPFAGRLAMPGEQGPGFGPAPSLPTNSMLLILVGLTIILLCLAVVYSFLRAKPRRRWVYILALLLGLLGLYLGFRLSPAPEPNPDAAEVAPEPTSEAETVPGEIVPVIELEVRPPAWLAWLAAALLALIAAAVILVTGWLILARAQRPPVSLPQIAEQAEITLAELETGADVHDAVMRCYLEMSRVLKQEQGLARTEAMTPREFESALRRAGLPREPVATLTHLFEEVRYGTTRPGRREEEEAIASLSAIVAACRSTT